MHATARLVLFVIAVLAGEIATAQLPPLPAGEPPTESVSAEIVPAEAVSADKVAEPAPLPPFPADANAVVAIRVGALLQSERARVNQWAERAAARLAGGEATIPPWAETFTAATLVRPGRPEPTWTATVVTTRSPEPLDATLTAANAQEEVAGLPAAYGDDRLYVRLAPRQLACFRPAVRQEAARWLRGERAGALSPYLVDALGRDVPFVMALDAADLFSPSAIAAGFGREGFTDEEVAAAVAGVSRLRGAALEVVVDETIHGRVRLTYDGPPPLSAKLAKRVFLRALADLGLSLDAFESATAITIENEIELDAILEDRQLRQITLLALFPGREMTAPAVASAAGPDARRPAASADAVAAATERYLDTIGRMLTDFERAVEFASPRANLAGWGDRYAERVLDLPLENVDLAAIEFGGRAAKRFRALSASLRGQNVRVNAAEGTLVVEETFDPGFVSVGPWHAGFRDPVVNVRTNADEVRRRQAAAVVAGADERQAIWTDLRDDLTRTRRGLAVKYGFGGR